MTRPDDRPEGSRSYCEVSRAFSREVADWLVEFGHHRVDEQGAYWLSEVLEDLLGSLDLNVLAAPSNETASAVNAGDSSCSDFAVLPATGDGNAQKLHREYSDHAAQF
jgi:hypothetical protein